MALTGIEIFKLLPKTNCGECGVPTCLAFAMNLAAGKTELSACPYVSEEAAPSLGPEHEADEVRRSIDGDGEALSRRELRDADDVVPVPVGQEDGLNPALTSALSLLRPGGESGPLELELEVRGGVEENLLPSVDGDSDR